MKNLGTGLGIKFKKHIKIKVIVSISQLRITCIMLILEIFKRHFNNYGFKKFKQFHNAI